MFLLPAESDDLFACSLFFLKNGASKKKQQKKTNFSFVSFIFIICSSSLASQGHIVLVNKGMLHMGPLKDSVTNTCDSVFQE